MLVAHFEEKRVEAADAIRENRHLCPKCKTQVVLKRGRIVVSHFAHKPPVTCDWAYGETIALIAVDSTHYPGERLVVCRNPALAQERARKRVELLAATEQALMAIATATARTRHRLHGQDQIALRVRRVIERYRMAKHFALTITENSFAFTRKQAQIDAETALDGLYVLRTNVARKQLSDTQTVLAYKSLAQVERAFRSMKTVDLHVRPIYHWNESRVRAHVFLCLLAFYVEWHLRQALKPLLHDDEELATLRDSRSNPVAPTPPFGARQGQSRAPSYRRRLTRP